MTTPLAHCVVKVFCLHCLPGYKYVLLPTPRVGDRTLVEYHNGVLHIRVHEMRPGVVASGHSPWTDLNQAVDDLGRLQEVHPVFLCPRES